MTASRSPSELDQYQLAALSTAKYTDNVRLLDHKGNSVAVYPFLKLAGEAGEVADKIGKSIRDYDGVISESARTALLYELGDVLWYVAACAKELGYELSHVAASNLSKLQRRAEQGTLGGSGDDR